MQIETVGRGPPLVMLHGWAMHSGNFRPLTDVLAQQHTLYLVDLPGHGFSRDSGETLELSATAGALALALPQAEWLGWSLGGLIALEVALAHPERVRALTLIATNPRFVLAPDWPHAVALEVFEAFGRDLLTDYRATLDRFLALECQGSDCARSELRELRTHVFERGEPALAVLEQGLALLEHVDLRARLVELRCPSLWIAGARDRLVPWQAMAEAAARAPGGRFVRIAGGGHAPFIGHPERVLDALAAAPVPSA
jgi:pimeloyl-[acyl-carrier protein] methyl ester esterase